MRVDSAAPVSAEVSVCVLTVYQGRLGVAVVRDSDHENWTLPALPIVRRRSKSAEHAGDDCDAIATHCVTGLFPQNRARASFLEQQRTYSFGGQIRVAYVALAADLEQALQVPTSATPRRLPASRAANSSRARVFAIDDVLEAEMLSAQSELQMVDAVERVRAKLEYTTVATSLLSEPFTIPELRRVYESVWGVALHAANFRRKVVGTKGFVRQAGPDGPSGPSGLSAPGSPELFLRGEAVLLHPAILRGTQAKNG